MIELIHEVALAALIGAMQQAIQHWFPWRLVFHRELPRVVAYIIGTLGYLIPLTVLYVHWGQSGDVLPVWAHLSALWACVVASGGMVLFVRAVDWLLDIRVSLRESRQRERALKELSNDKAEG
jgi:hypothetical protein